MKQYHDLLKNIYKNGTVKGDRTGTGTISLFGQQLRFDLRDGFPLVASKDVHFKSIVHELLWMISGDTNVKYLQENGVRIWNEWADENGDLGPVYGAQWRNWNNENIDQLKDVIDRIKTNPDCRRLIVNAWNPSVLPDTSKSFDENVANGKAALPPCHSFFQFYTSELSFTDRLELLHDAGASSFETSSTESIEKAFEDYKIPTRKLDLQMYQRSADVFLGVPFNIAFYALLLLVVADDCNMVAGEFVHTFGDVHIYSNHVDQIKEQLSRRIPSGPHVVLHRNEGDTIFDLKFEDIELRDYNPLGKIKAKVAI